jgi:hypothetical protein
MLPADHLIGDCEGAAFEWRAKGPVLPGLYLAPDGFKCRVALRRGNDGSIRDPTSGGGGGNLNQKRYIR